MEYVELTVHTTSEASELVADVMWEYTEGGVAVSDAKDVVALIRGDTGVYWDYIDEELQVPRTDVLVKCFIKPDVADAAIADIRRQLAEMKARGGLDFGSLEETRRMIDGDDWIDVWKKHFRPIHIGARSVSWEQRIAALHALAPLSISGCLPSLPARTVPPAFLLSHSIGLKSCIGILL